MRYALLAYTPPEDTDRAKRPIPDTLATAAAFGLKGRETQHRSADK